jgi:ATP-binding cassette subfamily B (MDR/TAP) protein 1
MTAPTERAAAEVATISKETSSSITIDEKHGPPSEEGVKPTTAALSDHEKQIIDRQTDAPSVTVSYLSLFRYANKKDVLIMIAALVASIASGAVMPLMTVRFHLHMPRAFQHQHSDQQQSPGLVSAPSEPAS